MTIHTYIYFLWNSVQPIRRPSSKPSKVPLSHPSRQPNLHPSRQPALTPTGQPKRQPSQQPGRDPIRQPSRQPNRMPSRQPSGRPSQQPTRQPNRDPSRQPSGQPVDLPSLQPSVHPSTSQPTSQPTRTPKGTPSHMPNPNPTSQVKHAFTVYTLSAHSKHGYSLLYIHTYICKYILFLEIRCLPDLIFYSRQSNRGSPRVDNLTEFQLGGRPDSRHHNLIDFHHGNLPYNPFAAAHLVCMYVCMI